ncbi:MAG: hypothetical protein CME05_00945 [Gemmatimonadaceae bacterium]|nr:hypothetical protein [Gemmatimonadaceae bacterium]
MMRYLAGGRSHRWGCTALLVGTVVLFANTFDNGFVYDDSHSIADNERLRDWQQIPSFFVDPGAFSVMPEARMYRPLLLTTYAINYAIDGAAGFHVVNAILHAVVVLLFYCVMRRFGFSDHVSLMSALLFAVHPIVTEPVNYVSSRSSSLVTLSMLGAMLTLLAPARAGQAYRLTGWTLLAVLTKATGVIIIPIVGWHLLLSGQRHRWQLLVGPTIVVVMYVVGTASIIGKAIGSPVRDHVSQWLTQVKALSFYLQSMVMPTHLSIEPQFSISASVADATVLVATVFCFSGLVLFWRHRRGAQHLAFGGGWVLLALAPTLVVPLNVLVNEHRLYPALPGFLLCAGWFLEKMRQRTSRYGPWFFAGVVLLVLLTWQRNQVWASPISIWEAAIEQGPQMARPHVNLGKAHLEQERFEEAIRFTRRGLDLNPALARGHYNIATAYLHLARHEQAIAGFQRALELDPALLEAWNNLGNVYKEMGRYAEALDAYRQVVHARPSGAIYHNLGSTYLATADYDSAAHYFDLSLTLQPDRRETHIGMARSLRQAEQLQASAKALNRALGHFPNNGELLELLAQSQAALNLHEQALATYGRSGRTMAEVRLRLGKVALSRGDIQRAEDHYTAGLGIAPDDGPLLNAMGEATLLSGSREEALVLFRRAARADPTLSVAFRNIGLVYLRSQRYVDAEAALDRARSLEDEGGRSKTWELLAHVYEGQADRTRAMVAYEQAIRRTPERATLHHNLGVLHEQVGARAQAEKLFRAALSRDPNLVEARHSLGHLLLVLGRYDEAAEQIEGVTTGPHVVDAQINLASAYLQLGRAKEAAAALDRFLQNASADDERRPRVRKQRLQLQSTSVDDETIH